MKYTGSKLQNKKGQALVEYAILTCALIGVFMAVVTPFCQAFDTYLQGIYYVLMLPVP